MITTSGAQAPPLETLILCQVPSSSRQFSPGSGCLWDPSADLQTLLPAALGRPGALSALFSHSPSGALSRLQRLSLAGLCVAVNELDALVMNAPRLTSLTLPQTATLQWLHKLAPLPWLQELNMEYIPRTTGRREAEARAPEAPAAAVHGAHAYGLPRARPSATLHKWECRGRMRALEVRRRRTLCRGDAFAVLAPQLCAFTGLTRLVWTEPLPARPAAGDWAGVLAASLRPLCQLQHLEVAAQLNCEPAGTARFAETLGHLHKLTYLNLSVCDVSEVASALGRLSELRGLVAKGVVRQEKGEGVFSLLAALPALRCLTQLRLSESRPWPKLPPCSRAARGESRDAGRGVGPLPVDPMERVQHLMHRATVCDHPGVICRAVEVRERMLDAVRGKLDALSEAPQLRELRLDTPCICDVLDALAPRLTGMRELQRLELATLGEGYHRAKRALWPHVLGLPLQEGVRLW